MKKTIKRKKKVKPEYNPAEWDDSKSVTVEPTHRPGELSTSIRLSREMIVALKRVAAKKGDIGYQTLIKIWVAERLEEEKKKAA